MLENCCHLKAPLALRSKYVSLFALNGAQRDQSSHLPSDEIEQLPLAADFAQRAHGAGGFAEIEMVSLRLDVHRAAKDRGEVVA